MPEPSLQEFLSLSLSHPESARAGRAPSRSLQDILWGVRALSKGSSRLHFFSNTSFCRNRTTVDKKQTAKDKHQNAKVRYRCLRAVSWVMLSLGIKTTVHWHWLINVLINGLTFKRVYSREGLLYFSWNISAGLLSRGLTIEYRGRAYNKVFTVYGASFARVRKILKSSTQCIKF